MRVTGIATESDDLTLRIRDQIERKRTQALLGGGQKRIDAQHAKVSELHLAVDWWE